MTVVSISILPASAGTDAAAAAERVKVITSAEGHVASYHGTQTEDPSVGYFISVWASADARKAFIASGKAGAAATASSVTKQYHVDFPADPLKALAGPTTAISIQPLKAPSAEAKAAVDGILNALSAARSGATVHGWTHEDPNVVIVLAAYESLDAHKAGSTDPKAVAVRQQLEQYGETAWLHVNLTKA